MRLGKFLTGIAPVEAPATPAIGAAYGGGYYAGQILVGGNNYALVFSPIAGEGGYLPYFDGSGDFTGGASNNDGWATRNEQVAFGITNFPQQNFCYGLTIGGFTDWYMPSRDELEMIYRNFKPTTAANNTTTGANTTAVPNTTNYVAGNPVRTTIAAFIAGGAQALTAEDYASSTALNFDYLMRNMDSGAATSSGFYGWYKVRAVRRVLLAA